MKNFYTIKEVAEMLDIGYTTAWRRVKQMNDEMIEQGYYAESGKVPVQLFHKKYPYIPQKEVS